MTLGATPFSIYATFSPEQIAYVVGDAEAKVALIEAQFAEPFRGARGPAARARARARGRLARGPGLRRRAALARGRARGPGHADLHVRHHRSAEGRPARAPQPDDGGAVDGVADRVPRRRARDLVAAERAHRRADGAPLPADRLRDDDHVLPEPARGARLPAGRQADLVLRRAADLGEAQGRDGGLPPPRRERRPQPRVARGRDAEGRARAGGGGGARRPRGHRRGGRPRAVRGPARDARARRGRLGQRRRGADAARGAGLLPRDRHPARRAVGHVGDLRRGLLQPDRPGQDRHRRAGRAGRRAQARGRRRAADALGRRDDRLPQRARQDRRGDRRRRLAAHRRHRRDRRRRLRPDRRPQEGDHHQRGRQEHVAGEHRVGAEGREPADRPGVRDRRRRARSTPR